MNLTNLSRYLQRNPSRYALHFPEEVVLIVAIPVLDDPDIFDTLHSLSQCTLPEKPVGVAVIVNHPERCDADVVCRNLQLAAELKERMPLLEKAGLYFRLLEMYDMPVKYAGVGLARKTVMDAALAHFLQTDNAEGVIISLDADTRVDTNYLTEIYHAFRYTALAGVSIAYAHRLDVAECEPTLRSAIIRYELYLRYYRQALYYAGHPYYHHCIGSAFAVKAIDYAAQGGMNRKQAGEDFYFLQKLMATGRYAELTATTVYPSARISLRTPFGTGQSVAKIIEDGELLTYDFQAFRELKQLFSTVEELYKASENVVSLYFQRLSPALRNFLTLPRFIAELAEINGNCASEKQFRKRFFDTFNAFQVLKYLNQSHESYFKKQPVEAVATQLWAEYSPTNPPTSEALLMQFRRLSNTSELL